MRERYEDFVKNVTLLESLEPYERDRLSDAFKTATFEPDETIIREGDWGDVFYILEEGEAIATKTLTPGQEPQEVMQYKVGDYFGELSLLRGEPRAANVIAKTKVKVVTLDRHSFKRMLGPLEEILKRQQEKYEAILKSKIA